MEEEKILEDKLSDIAAHLVTDNKYFVKTLFEKEKGLWLDIKTLCDIENYYLSELTYINETSNGVLKVTWLADPETGQDTSYRLVLFYFDGLLWTYAALCNVEFHTITKIKQL